VLCDYPTSYLTSSVAAYYWWLWILGALSKTLSEYHVSRIFFRPGHFRKGYYLQSAFRYQTAEMGNDEELIQLSFPQYWDERYKAEQNGKEELGAYEWFRSFQKLTPFFNKHLLSPSSGSDCHILHLGCGNSVRTPFQLSRLIPNLKYKTNESLLQTLSANLHTLRYKNQTSVDFSQVVIDAMKSKYAQLDTRWILMDVRELDFPDASVDIAIDKGTLDSFIHGSL